MKWILLLVLLVCLLSLAAAGKRRRRKGRRRDRLELQRARMERGLVPQLLSNYSAPVPPPAHTVPCSQATLQCAQRDGCGMALSAYLDSCSALTTGLTTQCGRDCRLSLVALLSTPEGGRLMECECEDATCREQKTRVEPCRALVTPHTRPGSVVPCQAATWICAADPLCSTALRYYNTNCAAMFEGGVCSPRCRNSLDILLRQKAAAKLATCYCDGTEDFQCKAIRRNTDVLCFGKKEEVELEEVEDNSVAAGARMLSFQQSTAVVSFLFSCWLANIGTSVSAFLGPGL